MCPGGSLWHSQGLSFGERKEGSWRFFSIFSFVVRIERVTAARKLNRGRNSWRFFCCVFFFSELLLCEPQKKKKKHQKTRNFRAAESLTLRTDEPKKKKKHDKKTLVHRLGLTGSRPTTQRQKKKKKERKEMFKKQNNNHFESASHFFCTFLCRFCTTRT